MEKLFFIKGLKKNGKNQKMVKKISSYWFVKKWENC